MVNKKQERRRPTHTVLVPVSGVIRAINALINAGCTFTCEPSPTSKDFWLVGLLEDGVRVISQLFETADVGTLGEYYPDLFNKPTQ